MAVPDGFGIDGLSAVERMEHVQNAVDTFLGHLKHDKNAHGLPWKHHWEGDGIVIHESSAPGTSLKVFKAETELEHVRGLDAFTQMIVPDKRLEWDDAIESIQVTHIGDYTLILSHDTPEPIVREGIVRCCMVIPPETRAHLKESLLPVDEPVAVDVVRTKTKPLLTVSARDFIDLTATIRYRNDNILSACLAMPAGKASRIYPEDSSLVRATNFSGGGWFLENVVKPEGSSAVRITFIIHCDISGWVPHYVHNSSMKHTFRAFFSKLRTRMAAFPPSEDGSD